MSTIGGVGSSTGGAESPRPETDGPGVRAQSETIGIALLTGVVVIVTALVGVVAIGNVTDAASDEPLVDASANATAAEITITHGGGDPTPTDELRIFWRSDSSNTDFPASGNLADDDGDDSFEPGEVIARSHSVATDTTVDVTLVHEPSNTVLLDTSVTVP